MPVQLVEVLLSVRADLRAISSAHDLLDQFPVFAVKSESWVISFSPYPPGTAGVLRQSICPRAQTGQAFLCRFAPPFRYQINPIIISSVMPIFSPIPLAQET